MRWVIQGQMKRRGGAQLRPGEGEVKAPLVLWGPYLWADGTTRVRATGWSTRTTSSARMARTRPCLRDRRWEAAPGVFSGRRDGEVLVSETGIKP